MPQCRQRPQKASADRRRRRVDDEARARHARRHVHYDGVCAATAVSAKRLVEVGVVALRRDGVRAVGRDDLPLKRVVSAEAVQRRQ